MQKCVPKLHMALVLSWSIHLFGATPEKQQTAIALHFHGFGHVSAMFPWCHMMAPTSVHVSSPGCAANTQCSMVMLFAACSPSVVCFRLLLVLLVACFHTCCDTCCAFLYFFAFYYWHFASYERTSLTSHAPPPPLPAHSPCPNGSG